ncbi:hypothetical protein ACRYJJ_07885 [Cylindrospermopsis raciborskii G7]|uniref:hypothetical protein n=1 Tax=Cylindrospermopsis raciborskii TaxID=77022 RepID=UPI003EBF5883
MASSAFSVDLYELTILPKHHARLEAQVITYAISRRGCNAISRRECFAIACVHVQIFPLRRT